jgi:Domain of unknown function (DUF4159)
MTAITYRMIILRLLLLPFLLTCFLASVASFAIGAEKAAEKAANKPTPSLARQVQVGNLVYAGSKTSKCFSDSFLASVLKDSGINMETRFTLVKSASSTDLAGVGFAVMTGEGAFVMTADERKNMKAWLENGGFLLASAGCSSKEWAASLRSEITQMFGNKALTAVTKEHPLFQTIYDVRSTTLKHDGQARFEGLILDGRLACLFSPEGLNDSSKVDGCCCCGGNEITNAHQIVANALVYALVE